MAANEPIRVNFCFDDWLAANWLVIRSRLLWKGLIQNYLSWWVVCFVLLLGFATHSTSLTTKLLTSSGAAVGAIVGWLICIRLSYPRAARKRFDAIGGNGLVTEYKFDSEQFVASNQHGVATLGWPMIEYWLEDPLILVVLAKTGILYVFPKAQIDSDALGSFRSALVDAHVPTR